MLNGKKPTDMLSQEHQEVLGKLDDMEQLIDRLNERDAVVGPLKELAAFFASDFWIHFTKEEEALFPEMETFIPRNAGPIGVMLAEHEDLRKTNDQLQLALGKYFSGADGKDVAADIEQYGMRFVSVLRDHIDKEDNILFRMADAHFTAAQDASVAARFEQIAAAKV